MSQANVGRRRQGGPSSAAQANISKRRERRSKRLNPKMENTAGTIRVIVRATGTGMTFDLVIAMVSFPDGTRIFQQSIQNFAEIWYSVELFLSGGVFAVGMMGRLEATCTATGPNAQGMYSVQLTSDWVLMN